MLSTDIDMYMKRFGDNIAKHYKRKQVKAAINGIFDTVPNDDLFTKKSDVVKAALAVYLEAGRKFIVDEYKSIDDGAKSIEAPRILTIDSESEELTSFMGLITDASKETGLGFADDYMIVSLKKYRILGYIRVRVYISVV